MEIYHHQRSFHRQHQRWAGSLQELGMDSAAPRGIPQLQLAATAGGFHATLEIPLAGDAKYWGHIRQDSRLRISKTADDSAGPIEAVLAAQADAWNRGDIDGFMRHYWKSDDLTFSSGGQTTRGWSSTRDGYLKRYPTREQMGQLRFTNLEITPLGDAAALVLGRWRLSRESGPIGGNFSLVLRRIDGEWFIIHDHTSRDANP